MNVDDLYGTLYVPKDGTMDPAGTCTTLARASTTRGAQVWGCVMMSCVCMTAAVIGNPEKSSMLETVGTGKEI